MNKLILVGLAVAAVVAAGCGSSESKEPAPGISFGVTNKPDPTNSIAGPRVPTTKAVEEPVATTEAAQAPAADPTVKEDVYYSNCKEVRAAGKAPLHRGDPGYRAGLDADHDGTACEK